MSQHHIDVSYVAKLARLDLTADEVVTFQSQLDAILEHVKSLSSVNLSDDLSPDDQHQLGHMRDDIPQPSLDRDLVLSNAPDQAQFQIRVPKVVADA
ncbi:MAG: Asp-tRNA(Asn)/Glu-tRNA(Gln) amidotransferase subunit GatC [Verrucomicrobiota bacterium]